MYIYDDLPKGYYYLPSTGKYNTSALEELADEGYYEAVVALADIYGSGAQKDSEKAAFWDREKELMLAKRSELIVESLAKTVLLKDEDIKRLRD